MATSTGDSQPYVRWGMISFHVDGEAATLTVYRDKDEGEFFLPFTDLTSGQSSYGEGRYVDVQPLHHGRFLVISTMPTIPIAPTIQTGGAPFHLRKTG